MNKRDETGKDKEMQFATVGSDGSVTVDLVGWLMSPQGKQTLDAVARMRAASQPTVSRDQKDSDAERARIALRAILSATCTDGMYPNRRLYQVALEGLSGDKARAPLLKLGDEVILERYRERGEHEGWRIIAIRTGYDIGKGETLSYGLLHSQGGYTNASADEVITKRQDVINNNMGEFLGASGPQR